MVQEPPITLLKAHPDEAEAINATATLIWPRAYRGIIPPSQIRYMLARMYDPATLREEMRHGAIEYFWIVCGSSKIGFIAIGPVLRGSPCSLHKCYLLPESQGCGFGSAAMGLLVTLLGSAGATSFELRVNRNNHRAISFYQKNGFETCGKDCREIGGGFVMDDYLMRRPIPVFPIPTVN